MLIIEAKVAMESTFRSKKVLKPDVPPPRTDWSYKQVENAVLLGVFGILFVGILIVLVVILMI